MSSAGAEYARRDRHLASRFARAASEARVGRIIYLGGLSETGPGLSVQLSSRREVERLLASTGVPVTVLRWRSRGHCAYRGGQTRVRPARDHRARLAARRDAAGRHRTARYPQARNQQYQTHAFVSIVGPGFPHAALALWRFDPGRDTVVAPLDACRLAGTSHLERGHTMDELFRFVALRAPAASLTHDFRELKTKVDAAVYRAVDDSEHDCEDDRIWAVSNRGHGVSFRKTQSKPAGMRSRSREPWR